MYRQGIKTLLSEKIEARNIKENEPMANHTSFKIGGDADLFITPTCIEEVQHAIAVCKAEEVPFYIIGNGSNLLVPDEGIRGVVIEIYKNLSAIEVKGKYITAQAGALLSRIAKEAYHNSLSGFEFAHGIPGTIGGAVTMNAGAYDGEMKDVLIDALVLSPEGDLIKLTKEELELSYRHSIVSVKGYIILEATICLQEGNQDAIDDKMKDFMGRRKDKQPLEYPSAGSTFKRPEGYFAGKLIMDSGLRGYSVGGAQVSSKHCGFVINTGNATCRDVLELIKHVQEEVKKQFGVTLETEVKLLGQ